MGKLINFSALKPHDEWAWECGCSCVSFLVIAEDELGDDPFSAIECVDCGNRWALNPKTTPFDTPEI